MASGASHSSRPPISAKTTMDPILRNALRYTISAKEYKTLHQFLITRSPATLRGRAPAPSRYTSLVQTRDDFNGAAIRASLRIFIITQTCLKLWELIKTRLLAKGVPQRQVGSLVKAKPSVLKSPNLRLSLSLSLILLLHRLLFRFFSRLRSNLLTKGAAPFRRRNPRISKSLTSQLSPAIGASLAGFALGVYPGDQLRITIAIYVATRSLEFAYNALDEDGWFKNKPWWWGSWILMPLASGQLLHAFVFDRDCFPKSYGDFILDHTPNYVQRRPASYPPSLPWPSTNTIVDSLAEMSSLNWPPFISPILFPKAPQTLPSSLIALAPITSPAHPSHTSLSCATLHPSTASCTKTFLHYVLTAFPAIAKFLAAFYALFALPKYRKFLASPLGELNALAKKVLRTSAFLTGAIGTSWGSICLFQYLLPRAFLPSSRWFLGGFMGGLWAFVDRKGGRGQVLMSVRLSVNSLWKVGVKRGLWRGFKGGDVLVFVFGFGVANCVYEVNKGAIREEGVRKGVGWLRGEELFGKNEGEEGEGWRER
ncbi:hypothetical protein MMC28_000509 [Mycoblastus sanguinarius]|nr:hypothetical protein [Mycoblastus sanguinarius]